MLDISVIILTLNEEVHIRRCIENVRSIAKQIFVVDCFSTDRTADIAKELGAEVHQHEWPGNQAAQFNWALENLPITTEWVLRLDADEYLTSGLITEMDEQLPKLSDDVTAVVFPLGRAFMGRVLKHGMAWVAEHHLAAAVSEAGGLGLIGAASAPAEWVREQIRSARKLTDKPFGVNIMLMSPYAADVAKVIVEEGVQVVTTGAGSPGKYMEMWKNAGIKVMPVVASVAMKAR